MAKHDDYWLRRNDEILSWLDQKDLDYIADMKGIYAQSALDLQKELYAFYAKYSDENGLTLQQVKEKLRREDLSDYRVNAKRYLEEAKENPELLKRLNEQYASARATRLDALALELTYKAGLLNGRLQGSFGQYLQEVAPYIYQKALGGRTGTLNAPAVEEIVKMPWDGHNYSKDLWKHTDKLAEDVKSALTKSFITGDNPKAVSAEIAKKYNVARGRAETLLRTEGTAVFSKATLRRYQDAGLKYYRDNVHLDERTTDICKAIHAEDKRKLISEMKIGVNAAPYHFNCRTGIVPDDEEINQEVDAPDDLTAMSADNSDDWTWPSYNRGNVIDKDTRNDLMQYARGFGIALQGLKRFDGNVELLRDYITRASEVLSMFPNANFEEHRPLTLSLTKLQPDDFAITRGHVIELNSGMFRDVALLEERYNSLRDSGWFAKGTSYKSIIDHEMGHVIDSKLNFDNLSIAKKILGNKGDDLLPYISLNLSEYAASYPDGIEISSEAFSSFMGESPSDFALQFMKEVLKYR